MDELVSRLAAGEHDAFARLYDALADRLHHYLVALLGSRTDADDVLQETFARLARHRRNLDEVENLTGYVFRIARNEARRFAERRSRRQVRETSLSADDRRQSAVLLHRKLAEPFTNLALLLVAVPLSLTYARTRGVAFGLSLVVTLIWYLFYTFGQLFAQTGQLPVWLGAWLGNIVFTALGLLLLVRRTR